MCSISTQSLWAYQPDSHRSLLYTTSSHLVSTSTCCHISSLLGYYRLKQTNKLSTEILAWIRFCTGVIYLTIWLKMNSINLFSQPYVDDKNTKLVWNPGNFIQRYSTNCVRLKFGEICKIPLKCKNKAKFVPSSHHLSDVEDTEYVRDHQLG